MWKRRAAAVVAGVTWGIAGYEATPWLPDWISNAGLLFVLSVAISATSYLALTCHQRPIATAFELGYEMGRRDAIREANRRSLSPIRREPHSLTALSSAARRSYQRT